MRFATLALLLLLASIPCRAGGDFVSMHTYAHVPGDTIFGQYTDTRQNEKPTLERLYVIDRQKREVPLPVITRHTTYDQYAPNFHVITVEFMVVIPDDFTYSDSLFRIEALSYQHSVKTENPHFYIVRGLHAEMVGLAPVDGAAGVGRRPTLTWKSMNPGIFNWGEVQLSAQSDFPKGSTRTLDTSAPGDSMVSSWLLEPNTTYYWRVRASLGTWKKGGWSPVYRFTTGASEWLPGGNIDDELLCIAATGGGRLLAGTIWGIQGSTNGGESWNAIGASLYRRARQIVIAGDLFVVRSSNDSSMGTAYPFYGSEIFFSTNGGASWVWSGGTSESPQEYNVIDVAGNGMLFSGSGDGEIKGFDHYGSASPVLERTITDGAITALFGNDGATMFAGTTRSATGSDPGGIYRTLDSGRSWTRLAGGLPADISVISFAADPAGAVYAVGSGGGIWRSGDNGASWTNRSSTLPGGAVSALASLSDGELIAALPGSGVYHSLDGGTTWSQLGEKPLDSVIGVAIGDDRVLYAATRSRVHQLTLRGASGRTFSPPDSANGVLLNGELEWPTWGTATRYHLQLSTVPFASAKSDEGRQMAGGELVVDDSALTASSREYGGLDWSTTYYWRTRALLADGWSRWSATRSFRTVANMAVPYRTGRERGLLADASPNPFSGSAEIRFQLPEPGVVTVTIHDARGAEVAVPASGRFESGEHRVVWDAADLPAGIYYYRIIAGERLAAGALVLIGE